jgi:cell division protein FtsB
MQKVLMILLALLLSGLHYALWLGDNGLAKRHELEEVIARQQAENAAWVARNEQLAAEIHDLKHGWQAIEERARRDFGMVKPGETFFLY